MRYTGRIVFVLLFICIVFLWHMFYFVVDYEAAYAFLIEQGHIFWALLFIPLLSPLLWWLGKQYDKAKYFAEKDHLTGLYNRRFVHASFPKKMALAEKEQKKLAVLSIDLNHFKVINDQYGHSVGDDILKLVSQTLVNQIKPEDVAFRWGGDEFVVLMANIDKKEDVYPFFEKIETEVNKKIPMGLLEDASTWVSFGVSIYPDDGATFEVLLKQADKKMYQFKSEVKQA